MKPLTIALPKPMFLCESGPTLTVLPSGYKRHYIVLSPGPGMRFFDELMGFVEAELSRYIADCAPDFADLDAATVTFLFNDDAARAVVEQRFGGF